MNDLSINTQSRNILSPILTNKYITDVIFAAAC